MLVMVAGRLEVIFFDQVTRNRTANHAAHNQSNGGTGDADLHGIGCAVFC